MLKEARKHCVSNCERASVGSATSQPRASWERRKAPKCRGNAAAGSRGCLRKGAAGHCWFVMFLIYTTGGLMSFREMHTPTYSFLTKVFNDARYDKRHRNIFSSEHLYSASFEHLEEQLLKLLFKRKLGIEKHIRFAQRYCLQAFICLQLRKAWLAQTKVERFYKSEKNRK